MNLIDRAKEVLNGGRKWSKGHYHSYAPGVGQTHCTLGAIVVAGELDEHRLGVVLPELPEVQALAAVVEEQYADRIAREDDLEYPPTFTASGKVARFNDHRDTTFEDVERVMEKASMKLEETVL